MSNLKHAVPQTILLALLMAGASLAGEPAQGAASGPQTTPSAPANSAAAAPATPSNETSLAQELRELRDQLNALRQEAAREKAAADSGAGAPAATAGAATPANPEIAPEATIAAPQAPTAPELTQTPPAADKATVEDELKQLREQFKTLSQAANTPTASPAQPAATSAATGEPQQKEVESLKTQIRALNELKHLREDLAKLRIQIQLEKDVLQGQASGAAGFARPALSTWLVKDDKGRFGIWVNPTKWTLSPYKQNPEARFELAHQSGDAYVFVFAENISLVPAAITKMALKNSQAVAPDAHIVFEDKRTVNGVDVTCLQIEGTLEQALPFTYLGYYYSGKGGTIQVVGSTAHDLFDKYKNDLYELLNGLEIYEASIPQPTSPKS